jgi:hypothetical protein
MRILDDGSIRDDSGRYIFVSLDRFKEYVSTGQVCFLCAKNAPNSTKEHIVPDWLLKECEIRSEWITLPNGTKIQYGKYVVPCCETCNHFMGKRLENIVSAKIKEGISGIESLLLSTSGELSLRSWLSLIFIKTHLKDTSLVANRDRRQEPESIAKKFDYDWGDLHHAYCVARSPLIGASIHKLALGSLAVVPTRSSNEERFDIIDLTVAKTFALRVGAVGLITVFGDGGAVLQKMQQLILPRVNEPLNYPQFREVVAHFACCNLHLKNPPRFATVPNIFGEGTVGITPYDVAYSPEFEGYRPDIFGKILHSLVYEPMKNAVDTAQFEEKLLRGELSFLSQM